MAVTDAEDGLEALQLWSPGAFEVVLTDTNMPALGGLGLAKPINIAQVRAAVDATYFANTGRWWYPDRGLSKICAPNSAISNGQRHGLWR